MSKSFTVHTEGADIACDVEGQGPLLLLVVGGNGDSGRFARLSAQLADRYTVVRYDRRANFRSTGDVHAELNMAQQGRDGAAVIAAMQGGPAYVFGNSAGANIALQIAQDHPQWVRGLVDHEPPITDILKDGPQWRQFFDQVSHTFETEGGAAAMKLFASSFVGLGDGAAAPADQDGNFYRFLKYEFNVINHFVPDVAALRQVPMVTAVGRASGNAFYAQTAHELARQVPCPCVEMVGHHMGYAVDAATFADELHQILCALPARLA
ncbi:alpha/beta fold hydrolase [Silvimonas iriomotensis]|uniref:Hydrolase YraK n=1 Tax=Silvimonas iriomotensis TaxID=449662 RepID=A0ABQ2P8M8_9NEIS|nr:alpha/beta hydrolase [Silvimonas iriomotensis]GGP20705.1 putative hydrolase YraK [Silvimonas iriomotensis]